MTQGAQRLREPANQQAARHVPTQAEPDTHEAAVQRGIQNARTHLAPNARQAQLRELAAANRQAQMDAAIERGDWAAVGAIAALAAASTESDSPQRAGRTVNRFNPNLNNTEPSDEAMLEQLAVEEAADCLQALRTGNYTAANRLEELERGVNAADMSNMKAQDIPELFHRTGLLIREDETVDFRGAPRQSNYFYSYAVDLILGAAEKENRPLTLREYDLFENILRDWLSLMSGQEEFNLNGVVYSRTEVEQIADGTQARAAETPQDAERRALAERMGALMGQGQRFTQSVHLPEVEQTNQMISYRMIDLSKGTPQPTLEQSFRQIEQVLETQAPANNRARRGLNRIKDLNATSPAIREQTTALTILPILWNYIATRQDAALKHALCDALIARLTEIHTEMPCGVGIAQRLLDVPSGIDPDMNVFAARKELGEQVLSSAARVNERFQNQIVEPAETFIGASSGVQEAGEEVLREVGMAMVEQRVRSQFGRVLAYNEADYAEQMERARDGMRHVV